MFPYNKMSKTKKTEKKREYGKREKLNMNVNFVTLLRLKKQILQDIKKLENILNRNVVEETHTKIL